MRCFVAVELPDHVREAVVASLPPDRRNNADVRWSTPEQWHITLAFFPKLSGAEVERLISAARELASPMLPVPLALAGAGGFPSSRRPRVFWRGVEDGGRLRHWVVRAEREMQGLPGEVTPGRFTPHVTLARAKTPAGEALLRGVLAKGGAGVPASWTADHICIFESRPGPVGARYMCLARAPLGAHGGSH